jgi:hypothetical protein
VGKRRSKNQSGQQLKKSGRLERMNIDKPNAPQIDGIRLKIAEDD